MEIYSPCCKVFIAKIFYNKMELSSTSSVVESSVFVAGVVQQPLTLRIHFFILPGERCPIVLFFAPLPGVFLHNPSPVHRQAETAACPRPARSPDRGEGVKPFPRGLGPRRHHLPRYDASKQRTVPCLTRSGGETSAAGFGAAQALSAAVRCQQTENRPLFDEPIQNFTLHSSL